MGDDDLKYLYAAYKMGGFEGIERDLNSSDFISTLVNGTLNATELLIVEVDKPVGIIVIGKNENLNEVHAEWFKWASSRNILEAALKFLHERRNDNVMTCIKGKYLQFYNKLSRYGVIRQTGVLEHLYGEGEHGTLFQSVRL